MNVTDTGFGMRRGQLDRLFTEFHQVDSGPARQHEGTGLGLALTRRFAELHGGEVSVESVPGKGSTFTLRLPLQRTSPLATTPVAPPPDGAILDQPLVLVVDDN